MVEAHARRHGGGTLRTQYLELADKGAAATVLARPEWFWGAEHGVNEHGVAVGNEMVNTVDDPGAFPPALIGMDLVRLGLERARHAEEAVDVMTGLLERHGQGGVGDADNGIAYWSSFLVADPAAAWVLETSGRRWAARPVTGGAAISNRLTLRRDWTRARPAWRRAPTSTAGATPDRHRVRRRAPGRRPGLRGRPSATATPCEPRAAVGALRDHGTGPWGAPGARRTRCVPRPTTSCPTAPA